MDFDGGGASAQRLTAPREDLHPGDLPASALGSEAARSHNLLGQRLGRKGRDTRERIMAATERLLADPTGAPVSLSAVAREASVVMTTLYAYFTDLTELLCAVLEPVMTSAEQSYMGELRSFWPDESLGGHCRQFVEAYHAFWVRHSRILHLRNSLADGGDERMRRFRSASAGPMIQLLVEQMGERACSLDSGAHQMAAVLQTGLERMITVATDASFPSMVAQSRPSLSAPKALAVTVRGFLTAETRLLQLAIADARNEGRD